MKKLMIAAAIVCAAALSQAASVSWQVGSITGPGEGGTGWSDEAINGNGYTAQLLVGSTFTDGVIGGLVAFDTDTITGAEEGYMFGYSTSDGMAADTLYYAQVIVKSGDSTLSSGVFQIEAGSANDGVAEPVFALAEEVANLGTFTGGSSLDPTYGAFSAAGWQGGSTPTPEPTSGLLLLLGVAGLALRRRRA